MRAKNDGKIRDVDIRLAFIARNMGFFEQPGFEFVNEFGINSTNIIDLAAFDFNHKNDEGAVLPLPSKKATLPIACRVALQLCPL